MIEINLQNETKFFPFTLLKNQPHVDQRSWPKLEMSETPRSESRWVDCTFQNVEMFRNFLNSNSYRNEADIWQVWLIDKTIFFGSWPNSLEAMKKGLYSKLVNTPKDSLEDRRKSPDRELIFGIHF